MNKTLANLEQLISCVPSWLYFLRQSLFFMPYTHSREICLITEIISLRSSVRVFVYHRNSEDIDTFVLTSSRDSDGITCLTGRCHEMSLRTIERSRHSHSTGSIRLECIIIESTNHEVLSLLYRVKPRSLVVEDEFQSLVASTFPLPAWLHPPPWHNDYW